MKCLPICSVRGMDGLAAFSLVGWLTEEGAELPSHVNVQVYKNQMLWNRSPAAVGHLTHPTVEYLVLTSTRFWLEQ